MLKFELISKRARMLEDNVKVGLTFDDALLLPAKSEVIPREIKLTTHFSKNLTYPGPVS